MKGMKETRNVKVQKDQFEQNEEIRLLQKEKIKLISIICSNTNCQDKRKSLRLRILEGKCSKDFKIKYPSVYLEILRNQVNALRIEANFSKSVGFHEFLM